MPGLFSGVKAAGERCLSFTSYDVWVENEWSCLPFTIGLSRRVPTVTVSTVERVCHLAGDKNFLRWLLGFGGIGVYRGLS
jgi:hypothetical protein